METRLSATLLAAAFAVGLAAPAHALPDTSVANKQGYNTDVIY